MGIKVSRQTVKNVLVEAGLGPEPHHELDTWQKSVNRHAATLWQCDFANKLKWMIKGLVDIYFPVFSHIGTRQI